MIRQLVRCDPAWKVALSLAPAGVLGGFLMTDRDAAAITLPFIAAIAMIVRPHERATLFTAALPVPARQVFAARVCAVLATWWLPALAAMITVVALGRPIGIAARVGELGLTVTACVMIPFSLRPTEFAAPWRPLLLWAGVTCVAVIPLTPRSPEVLASVSVVAAGLLLARTWRAIPGSFQAAPVEAVRASARRDRGGQPAWTWWPVVRALFAPLAFFCLPAMLLQATSKLWMVGALYGSFPLSSALSRSHWVLTLPLRRNRMLAAILVCCGLPVMAGYYLKLLLPQAPEFSSEFVLKGGAVLTAFLVLANAILIANHHRWHRLPKAAQVAWIAVAGPGMLLPLADAMWGGIGITRAVDSMLSQMAATIPNLWLAAAVALAPAAALWWTAARLFEGTEVLQARYPSMWEANT